MGAEIEAYFRVGVDEQSVAARTDREGDVLVRPRVVHTKRVKSCEVDLLPEQVGALEALAGAAEMLSGLDPQGQPGRGCAVLPVQADDRQRVRQGWKKLVLGLKSQVDPPIRGEAGGEFLL